MIDPHRAVNKYTQSWIVLSHSLFAFHLAFIKTCDCIHNRALCVLSWHEQTLPGDCSDVTALNVLCVVCVSGPWCVIQCGICLPAMCVCVCVSLGPAVTNGLCTSPSGCVLLTPCVPACPHTETLEWHTHQNSSTSQASLWFSFYLSMLFLTLYVGLFLYFSVSVCITVFHLHLSIHLPFSFFSHYQYFSVFLCLICINFSLHNFSLHNSFLSHFLYLHISLIFFYQLLSFPSKTSSTALWYFHNDTWLDFIYTFHISINTKKMTGWKKIDNKCIFCFLMNFCGRSFG